MRKINPQSSDRTYKFIYKVLGILFHRYLYSEGENIEFIDTEIPDTGQRRDITTVVDGKFIRSTEFLSTPLYDDKLSALYDYHQDLVNDENNGDVEVISSVVSISNPNWGFDNIDIDSNINFHLETIFIQECNGWEILSTIVYKTIIQEDLSVKEAIDLLILPDMEVEIRNKSFMKMICFLICHANIPDADLKRRIVLCELHVLERFFAGDELSELINMLRCETKDPKVARIIEEYGPGFDVIYYDGKEDGILESIEKLLAEGVDEEIISRSLGFSIDQIREIKRKL